MPTQHTITIDAPSRPKPKRRPLRIAVVDDDANSIRAVMFTLEARGHAVDGFDDPGNALLAIQAAAPPFDAVVCDLSMPKLSGDLLCGALRSRMGAWAPPVIMLSAADDPDVISGALEAGARHFIRKPFSGAELCATTERAAKQRVEEAPRQQGWIGPYRILEELGSGASGTVYRARSKGQDEVALKVVSSRGESLDEVLRFRRELALLSGLEHPHVVSFHEGGRDGHALYLAMELVEGPSLRELIPDEGMGEWRRVARIGLRLADALAYVHARGLIHRDVKPANVVIGPGDDPVLIDFGLARRPQDTSLTRSKWVCGTPGYTPPELLQENEIGPEGDVFALGVTLLVALLGYHPLKGAGGAVGMMLRLRDHGFPPARDLLPHIPRGLQRLLDASLRRDPRRRPTANQLAAGLSRMLNPRLSATRRAPPPKPTRRRGPPPARAPQRAPQTPPRPRPTRRRPR